MAAAWLSTSTGMAFMKHLARIATTALAKSMTMGWMMSSRNKKRGYELGFTVECKRKKSGFKFLLDSLDQDNADILICRQDGRPIRRLYVMEEETVEALFRQAGIIK